ncbi:MAG: trigger factor, partial [Patescibacteria group bacterium]
TIDDIRKMRSKETLVTRPAKMGDKVLIDIEMFINKVLLEGGQSKGTIIILGDSYFIPGLDEQIVGLKEGEEKEFTLPYPDEYYDKKLAGKKVDFKIKVTGVYQMDLPELDETFIAGLGNFKTIEDLKNKIRENLEAEETQKNEYEIENEVLSKLIECCEFENIPHSLIESETDRMLDELQQNIEGQGIQFDDYLLQLKKSPEDIKKDFEDKAKKRTQVSLAIRQICLDEKIQATEADIEAEIEKILKMYPDNENVKQQVENQNYRLRIGDIVANQKTVEHIKSHIVQRAKSATDKTKSTKD